MFSAINVLFFGVVAHFMYSFFFFFNDTAPTEIYPLPLHAALPISDGARQRGGGASSDGARRRAPSDEAPPDRKSTRLNSSHPVNSYAVFCLKKKKKKKINKSWQPH